MATLGTVSAATAAQCKLPELVGQINDQIGAIELSLNSIITASRRIGSENVKPSPGAEACPSEDTHEGALMNISRRLNYLRAEIQQAADHINSLV